MRKRPDETEAISGKDAAATQTKKRGNVNPDILNKGTEIVLWFFMGSIAVLIIKNAKNFATATTAVGSQVQGMGLILTGAKTK